MTTTRIVDLKGAREALPMRNVRCPHQKINPEQLCYVCKGENDVVNEIQSVNLEVDVEAMVDLIAKYHFELGLRIKSGSKEVVSPSRELAQVISTNIPKWAKLVRK